MENEVLLSGIKRIAKKIEQAKLKKRIVLNRADYLSVGLSSVYRVPIVSDSTIPSVNVEAGKFQVIDL